MLYQKYVNGGHEMQSGRTSRPSNRAKLYLAESMVKGFLALYTETLKQTGDIDKMIIDKTDPEALQRAVDSWYTHREQLSRFYAGMQQHVGPAEYKLCSKDMADLKPFLDKVDTAAMNVLDAVEDERGENDSVKSKISDISSEISRLESEYQRSLKELGSLRGSSPSPAPSLRKNKPSVKKEPPTFSSSPRTSRYEQHYGHQPPDPTPTTRLPKVSPTPINPKKEVSEINSDMVMSIIAALDCSRGFRPVLREDAIHSGMRRTLRSLSQDPGCSGVPASGPLIIRPRFDDARDEPQEVRYRPVRAPRDPSPLRYHGDYVTSQDDMTSPGRLSVHAMLKVADAMIEKSREDSLPKIEPTPYGGDPLQFSSWWNTFGIMLSGRRLSDRQKLLYLIQYTTEGVRTLAEGYLNLPEGEPAFERAKTAIFNRYGNRMIIADSYKQKLSKWPKIKEGDGKALASLSDFLWQCHHVMKGAVNLDVLHTQEENAKIASKLPYAIQLRWYRRVDKMIHGGDVQGFEDITAVQGEFPRFDEFCKFMAGEARVATGPCASLAPPQRDPPEDRQRRTFLIDHSRPRRGRSADNPTPRCSYCKEEHYLYLCEQFLKLPVPDKKEYAMRRGLCFGCLRRGHRVNECTINNKKLMAPHPEAAEAPEPSSLSEERELAADTVTSCNARQPSSPGRGHLYTYVVPVRISIAGEPGKHVTTFAAVDNQSNCSFVTDRILDALNERGEEVSLELTTMSTKRYTNCRKLKNIEIRGLDSDKYLSVPCVYSRDTIPIGLDCVPNEEVIDRWEHLKRIKNKIRQPGKGDKIEMLIGYNCPKALLPLKSSYSDDTNIFAVETPLGWSVTGSEAQEPSARLTHCYRTTAREVAVRERCGQCLAGCVQELTHEDLVRAFDAGFAEPENDKGDKLSANDAKFIKIVSEGISITKDKKFEMPLPFKEKPENLPGPESREHAVRCLRQNGRKMKKHPSYGQQYKESMNKLVTSDQAERIPYPDVRDPDKMFYWSHHGVMHPRKKKLRTVFNGSTKIKGVALNDLLLTGPDLTNNLVGVLMRFRREIIAVMCDIEGMFHQVKIHPFWRDFVRFVWFKDGDPDAEILDYRMTVHLFGASSSPGCANYALKEAARRYEAKYGSEAAQFLRDNFYVDDGLGSQESTEKATELVNNSHGMCAEGGFNLCKFDSNSQEVLDSIPASLRADGGQTVELDPSGDGSCALGVGINLKDDTLVYRFAPKDLKNNRRGYLSGLSSVYDPLGLIGPAILPGRIILQKLCAEKVEWDEELDAEVTKTWNDWYQQLKDINEIVIDRCLKSKLKGEIVKIELHTFVDASTLGLGICIYLVQRTETDFQSALIFGKSKVAPLKTTTIPRLELQAAVLGVQAAVFVESELMMGEIESYYYSDSKIVLAYISNLSLRCHMYVNNRASFIRSKTQPRQWRYVDTHENPADLASRGVSASELRDSTLWWSGPTFLSRPHDADPETFALPIDDPEVKKGQDKIRCFVTSVTHEPSEVEVTAARKSSWESLLGVYTKIVKVFLKIKKLTGTEVEIRQLAEEAMWRSVQRAAYPDESALLAETTLDTIRSRNSSRNSSMKPLPRSSPLYKLDPFLDESGLIRVGGRLNRGEFPDRFKHPVILPASSRAVELKVQKLHEDAAHPGANWTLGLTRTNGMWIVRGKKMINRITRSCVACTRQRKAPMTQKMSPLPEERLRESEPFSYSAADLFGPFEVKFSARSVRKRWIVIFVCLCSRGIHMEVVESLETCSFLTAYRRFVGRRGPVRVIWCDRGTNFIGADRALKAEREMMLSEEVREYLKKRECDLLEFRFNTPKASHMAGAWERMIRTVRSAMFHTLSIHPQNLTDDQFATVVVESEALVNSRPVSYVDGLDTDDPVPISPAQLLTLKTDIAAPLPGVFRDTDRYAKKRWKYVQYLAGQFWDRWRHMMTPKLQTREKWQKPQKNLKKDDIVILMEDDAPRGKWPLARVLETMPGEDGLVRRARLRVRGTELERPITKMIHLIESPTSPADAGSDDVR